MSWHRDDPQGNESGKIRWELVKWTRGRGLDIGAGLYRTFPHFITVDNNIDAMLFKQPMPRPDVYVDTAENLSLFADNSMDFVFSSHMLEHVAPEHVTATLREWLRVVKVGGYLLLYLPDEDQYPKVGEEGANPDHKWNVSFASLLAYMRGTARDWDLVDFQKRDQGQEYSLFFVFQKLSHRKEKGFAQSWRDAPKHPKTCGVVRYGAFGDLMQASAVLAGLKEQGYHVTLYTSNPGAEVVKACPHIDEFYHQDVDQVPNQALGEFWDHHAKKYDKWVNLSESVEGALLTMAKYPAHFYAPAARHKICDKNYIEHQCDVAGVELTETVLASMRFYPTPEEEAWAKRTRAEIGARLVIVWSLAGSSVHKHWPWVDNCVSGLLLDFPEAEIVFVGGPDGVVLEQGWEKTPRVHCRSGKWSIRQTLSFIRECDVLIGAETGTLNSAAMLPIPKVVFLSHSTHENLTRDWINVHPLRSENTKCKGRGDNEAPACHMLHYGWTWCTEAAAPQGTEELHSRKGAGVAQCQIDITAESAYKVIWHVTQWRAEELAQARGEALPGVVEVDQP